MPVSDVFPKCVLFEDNHCLVVNKPPRLLTVADQTQHENLLDLAKEYLKEKYKKPGEFSLGFFIVLFFERLLQKGLLTPL